MQSITITDVRSQPGDSAFLIDDGQTAICYDTGFAFTGYSVAEKIRTILKERSLDYIFLTHSHYDHVLGSSYLRKFWPNATIVAADYASVIFKKTSAREVMRDLDRKFAAACGVIQYEDLIDSLRVDIPVNDGDWIQAGSMNFQVVSLPGHTKCSVGYYLPEHKLLLGTETLGVYDSGQTVVPSFLIGYQTTLASMEKALTMDIQSILLPHYGLLPPEKTAFYLQNGKQNTIETAEKIVQIIRSGGSEEDAAQWFQNRFYHGYIQTIYPIDAMQLNTGIMIRQIRKELLP